MLLDGTGTDLIAIPRTYEVPGIRLDCKTMAVYLDRMKARVEVLTYVIAEQIIVCSAWVNVLNKMGSRNEWWVSGTVVRKRGEKTR